MISVQHPMRRHNDYLKLREQRDREENIIHIETYRPLIQAAQIAHQKRKTNVQLLLDILSTLLIGVAVLWGLRVFVWPVVVFWGRSLGILP